MTPTLQELPFDILQIVADRLDYLSLSNLSRVNRTFRSTFNAEAAFRLGNDSVANCLEADRQATALYDDTLTCFYCWRSLPTEKFGTKMTKNSYGRNSKHPEIVRRRHCLDCGLYRRLYHEHSAVRIGKILWYPCFECNKYRTRSQRCQLDPEPFKTRNGHTGRAHKTVANTVKSLTILDAPSSLKTSYRHIQGHVQDQIVKLSRLQQLPEDIHGRILWRLSYVDLIRLSQTNRFFHKTVRPERCSLLEKVQFVREHFVYLSMLDPEADLGQPCYSCFKLRPASSFTQDQWTFDQGGELRSDQIPRYYQRSCTRCMALMVDKRPRGRAAQTLAAQKQLCDKCAVIKEHGRPCWKCSCEA